jgi:dTDP-4-amino-4,6-dideoxygalactose transaminase
MSLVFQEDLTGPPAIDGGTPAFPERLPLVRPSIGADQAAADIALILKSGTLTNGPYVREFERRAAEYLGVDHCVAVASCTSGLMLIMKASGCTGNVIIPAFTFSATAHAVAWNGMTPRFADIDPDTLTLSAAAAEAAITPETSAILAVHTYGTPCDVEGLTEVAQRHGLRLFFDAAHAFGSRHGDRMVGNFGDAEVFSLSPTKVLVAAEGGLVATNDGELAELLRIGRDYGNPGDYNCRFVGLNARMSELHAATALSSIETLEEQVQHRNRIGAMYREAFADIPGISFPEPAAADRSTYKDFTIIIDPETFGMDIEGLIEALSAEGIDTRRYYRPLVNTMDSYEYLPPATQDLSHSYDLADRVLTLPMWSSMPEAAPITVGKAIRRLRGV